jgi:hypothetical protein
MFAWSQRPGRRNRLFGLLVFGLAMMPAPIGYQDLAALIARQPAVSDRWRQHILASPFGTIHAATFSFPQPLGTLIPAPLQYQLANFDPRSLDVTGSIPRSRGLDPLDDSAPLEFPIVDRKLKGDLLVPRARPLPQPAQQPKAPVRAKDRDLTENGQAVSPVSEARPQISPVETKPATEAHVEVVPETRLASLPSASLPEPPAGGEPFDTDAAAPVASPEHPSIQTARLFFGPNIFGSGTTLEPWQPGDEPVIAPRGDPDFKLSALRPDRPMPGGQLEDGESIAPKGEVTGEGRRPKTPAERLGLVGKERARHEKCLADAIYFESRGEPLKGQEAVAQVVMNRVFSGKYPDNVCGVVYQNANRYLACQFTFACEGKKLVIDEPDMWEQAKRIARDTLDGKVWVPEVGKSTHYHAYWVRPSWVGEMRRLYKFGVHTFYRPRAWGDGADEPAWGAGAKALAPQADAAQPSVAAAKL